MKEYKNLTKEQLNNFIKYREKMIRFLSVNSELFFAEIKNENIKDKIIYECNNKNIEEKLNEYFKSVKK